MHAAREELEGLNNTPITLGQKVSNTASAVMSLGMAITTVKGLIDTWNNQDLSIGEKLTTTLTSGAMAVGMLVNAFNLLNISQLATSISSKLVATDMGLIFAGDVLLTGANGVLASSFVALEAAMGPVAALLVMIGVALAAIAGLVGIGVAIANAIVTPKEHLENLAAQTEQAKTTAEDAKTAYDNLLSGINTHNQLLEELDKLTVGTLEFQEALLKANTAASELISNYNLSPDDYTVDQNGAIRINEEALQRVRGEKLRESQQRQEEYLTAQAIEASAKAKDNAIVLDNISRMSPEAISSWANNSGNNYIAQLASMLHMSEDAIRTGIINKTITGSDIMVASGAASKNQIAIQNKLLSQKNGSSLDNFDNLLASALSTDSNFWDRIDQRATHYSRRDEHGNKEGSWIDLDNKNTTLNSLQTEYERIYGRQALLDLQASDTWGNLGDKDARKKYLANAIKEFNSSQLLETELNKRKELANREEIKQYKNASKLTGQEIIELRTNFELRKAKGELDEETAKLEEQLNNALWNRYQATSNNFIKNGIQAFGSNTSENDQFASLATSLTEGEMAEFNGLYGQAVKSFGEGTGKFIAENYFKNGEINKAFQTALSNFDMTQGNISALAELQSGKSSFGKWDTTAEDFEQSDIYQFADKIKKNAGEKGLFEELYNSEDFADSLSDLQKEFKKTGKISAKSIMEAAESSETLANWLDVSGVGAQGLADALSALGTGSIDSISEALLRAFGAAGQLESSLAKTYDYIDNFEEERSIEDIGKFYSGLADSVQEGFESGFLLDKPVLQALEETFGTKLRNKYMQDIYSFTGDEDWTPEQISDAVNSEYADQIKALQSIQERGNLSGMFEYAIGQGREDSNITDILSYNEKTGQIVTKKWDEMSAEQQDIVGDQEAFINMLQKEGGVSEELARAMANEYGATNGDIYRHWRENAAMNGLGEFGAEDINSINAADLRAFYDSYGDVLQGLSGEQLQSIFSELDLSNFDGELSDANELVSLFKQNTEKLGKTVVDLGEDFNFATDDLSDLKEAFNENSEGQNFFDYFNSDLDKQVVNETAKQADGTFAETGEKAMAVDFNDATKKLKDLGATAEQAYTKLDEMKEAGDFNAFSKSVRDADGNMQALNSEMPKFKQYCQDMGLEENAAAFAEWTSSIEESEAAMAAAKQQAKVFADALVESLTTNGDNSVELSFNEDGTLATIQTTISELGNEPVKITFATPDTSPISQAIKNVEPKTISVGITATPTSVTISAGASGYNNAKGFAGGKHLNGQYEGLADVGELGPELFIHDGQPYLAGIHGRTRAYVHKDDSIYTAAETKQILEENPSLRDIPGFSVGYNQVQWGKKGGANANNTKTSKYDPERYHLITRQLKDLQREYDRLNKIKENCYGTNKLEAIQQEIDATQELINGQKELIKEAEDYLEIDKQRLKSLLANGEFQVDANGNLLNFEELQEKYRRKAEEDKDEAAQDVWKALQQYEETLDKLHDANTELQNLIYQQSELALETITTKVELKIDFDERDLKLIEHFTKKIDDNIYDTAKVLQLAGLSLDKINDKIDTTRQGITEIFENMTDSKGNQIADMTLEKFLSLSEAERDALDINHDFGKQLEEYSDDLLNYIEDLEDLKTKGIDELNQAFDELNDNIQSSMDLFNYYQDTLDNLKNIIDLQGVTISKDLRDVFQTINQTLLSNNANNIQAELVRYEKLRDVVIDLQNKLSAVTDPTLQKEWENQLKEAEEALRDSQTNLLTLWQNGLDMAKQVFEQNIDNAVREFEEQVAGAYGDLNGLQAAYDRRKEIDNFYVDDYEKYYQISKLQRQINKDLNDAAKNHNKNVKGLNILFDDLNDAREAGVELTAYDLDIFAKRYAYEKALMDLEDSRNAKQQVRLQRDANGNWGYVYTAAEDDDDLIRKQQAVEDALYEWQKATTTEANKYSDEILPKIRTNLEAIAEAYKTGSDIPQNILNDTKELLSLWGPQFQKTLEDGAQTLDIAIDRYNNANFDILDNLNETGLAAVLDTGEGIDQLLDILISQMETANNEMNTASINYKNQIDNLNNFFKEYGDSLGTVINAWAQAVGEDSEENKANTSQMIENAKLTFDEILSAANEFEDKFMEKYEPIISRNEQFIIALNEALDALNRKEFVQGQLLPYIGSYIDPSSFASGGFTGAWGSGGRLAVLHEKENVFNAEDTSRLLSASQILRTIDLSISSFAAGFGNILLPNPGPIGNSLDQNVHIEASFPSVTDHNEIELAFDNLINKASQYANRKNMSSMTFQDMYTSKF